MKKQSEETGIALIQKDVSYIKERVDKIDDKLSHEYVTKIEFEPIKRIVYGTIGVLGIATVGALLKLIFIK